MPLHFSQPYHSFCSLSRYECFVFVCIFAIFLTLSLLLIVSFSCTCIFLSIFSSSNKITHKQTHKHTQHTCYASTPANTSAQQAALGKLVLTNDQRAFIQKYKPRIFTELSHGNFWDFDRRTKTIVNLYFIYYFIHNVSPSPQHGRELADGDHPVPQRRVNGDEDPTCGVKCERWMSMDDG